MKKKAATKHRPPVVMEQLVHRDQVDGSFDAEFWRRVGAEGRFAAAWQMVKEVSLMRGGDGKELEFQKDVERLEKREPAPGHRRRGRRRDATSRKSRQ